MMRNGWARWAVVVVVAMVLSTVFVGQQPASRGGQVQGTMGLGADQTLVHVVILEFESDQPGVMEGEFRKQAQEGVETDRVIKRLEELGKVEILSRPNIMLQELHQQANITIGERVPVVQQTIGSGAGAKPNVAYQDVGISLDVRGQWLDKVDAHRAYLRIDGELSMIGDGRADEKDSDALQIVTRTFEEHRLVEEGKPTWVVLEQSKPGAERGNTKRWVVVAVAVKRIVQPAGATSPSTPHPSP